LTRRAFRAMFTAIPRGVPQGAEMANAEPLNLIRVMPA
jgi:hypothetical protein